MPLRSPSQRVSGCDGKTIHHWSIAPVDFSLKYRKKEYTVAVLYLRWPPFDDAAVDDAGCGWFTASEEPESRFAPLHKVYQSL